MRSWLATTLPLCALGLLGLLTPSAGCNRGSKPAPQEGCAECHASPEGKIEEAHPFATLTCSECHGGDPLAKTAEAAHISAPAGTDDPRRMAADQIDELPLDYLRFINPGDLRVADVGCGAGSPAAGGSGCHATTVDTVSRSVMSTFVGHYNVPRYLAGLQGYDAEFGSRDIVHTGFDPATAPDGAVGQISALRPPPEDAVRTDMATLMDHYLVKSCPTCHAYSFGPNNAVGNYRSSGCTSCHMLYENDGLSRSADPHVDKTAAPHPARHELTTAIPETQCEHCHFQGSRIGLLFQGIREGGFEDVPPNATPLGEARHNRGPDFYFTDEDNTNDIDETPPDLHFTAGMTCVDCHVGVDVHGDGNMYSTAKYQVGIRCEDCHGTVREPITESDDGAFYSTGGSVLRQLSRAGSGSIVLTGKMDGEEHLVKQIKQTLDLGTNPRMVEAMAPDPVTGFSHTDTMECYACHSGYRQNCFGCHVSMDDRFSMSDHQTGRSTTGLVQGARDWYDLELYLLGTNGRGKISSVCPSQQVFISYIDGEGNVLVDEQVRTTADGKLGFGWQPNHQHTTQKVPQNCDRCHPVPDESNLEEVRHTYGFGTGQYFLTDGNGVSYDLTRILDDDGNAVVDFGHKGTGPVPKAAIERALNVRVEPQARE